MKRCCLWTFFITAIAAAAIAADLPSNKIFTYQGRLMDDNIPADAQYDFAFTLFDGPDPDTASEVTLEEFYYEHPVSDGYFTVELNFSPFGELTEEDIFNGSPRWLQIGIRPGQLEDPNEYTYLEPLTKLTAAPYAHLAHRLQTPAALRNETTEPVLTIANEGEGPEMLIDGNGTIRYLNDALTEIADNYSISVGSVQNRTIGTDSIEGIGRDLNLTIGRNETKTVGANSETTIILSRTTTIGTSDETLIGAARVTNIGAIDMTTVGTDSTNSVGGNILTQAGQNIVMAADNVIRLQNKVSVSNDPNDLLKLNGAVSLEPMDTAPPLTTGYGKLFVNNTDGKIYFLDSSGNLYDLTAVSSDRVSFSVKRDLSYAWPASPSFENVDFTADTTILDNTGLGFNHKSGAFIAPADGLYTFHGAICFTSLGKGDQISAAVNAAGIRYRADMTSAVGGEETVRASITLYLNEDDQVTLQGYVSAAAPPAYAFGNPGSTEVFTYFSGARVD